MLALTRLGAAAPADEQQIDLSIAALVGQFSDGIAVGLEQYRQIGFGRVFGGPRDDAVAWFSVEGFDGTNYHAEYLAFFAAVPPDEVAGHKTRPYRLVAVTQVGGRGWRSFDGRSMVIRPQGVSLRGKAWGAQDPGCCPSQPIVATFVVHDGSIAEEAATSAADTPAPPGAVESGVKGVGR